MNIDDLVSELRTSAINAIETHATKEEQLRVLGNLENLQMVCPENEDILAILIPYCEYMNLNNKAQFYFNKLYKLNPHHTCIQQYSEVYTYTNDTQNTKENILNSNNSDYSNIEIPDFLLKDGIIVEKKESNTPDNKQLDIKKDTWSKDDKLSKSNSNFKNILPILLLIIALIIIIYNKFDYNSDNIKERPTPQIEIASDNSANDADELNLYQPTEYNYLTKQQIYDIRKKQVALSNFASSNYEPNEEVFGQIVDNKPWWGIVQCRPSDYKPSMSDINIKGVSNVSVLINNPNMLLNLTPLYVITETADLYNYCHSNYSKWIPTHLKYDSFNNQYVLTYTVNDSLLSTVVFTDNYKYEPMPFQIQGLNARDFGFEYAYINNYKNIHMLNKDNMSKKVIQFRDFIHLGGSCEYKDGCNNISPYQPNNEFYVTALPAQIDVKLWKNEPSSSKNRADINFRIELVNEEE